MYLVTLIRKLLIMLAVISDYKFHTPMYFFLSNLSFVSIYFTSTTVPKMIVAILTQCRVISYVGCLTQMSLLIISGCMDDMLLTVMAYDWFVAICHLLHYPVIISPQLCIFLGFFFMYFARAFGFTAAHFDCLEVHIFNDVLISHFCCEPAQLLNIDCSENVFFSILIILLL
ncbi:olfactory receptor 7E24-like [Fukomys damarensis]|uniref:olfactory receptor 7E24-like n=1 Tax=Fukomys damarensis TaxID=885580 RepID=UPI00145515D2|nr:olfactory receptor 7E24-like [Fukomys damarensis]